MLAIIYQNRFSGLVYPLFWIIITNPASFICSRTTSKEFENGQSTIHLGLSSPSEHNFYNQYSTPDNLLPLQSKTRAFASTLGLTIETIATKTIAEGGLKERPNLDLVSAGLYEIIRFLKPKIALEKPPQGKTLSHQAVLPHYLRTCEEKYNLIANLTVALDEIHGLKLHEMFGKLTGSSQEEQEDQSVKDTSLKYFLDGLLIMARLTKDGIGENLDVFGRLVPNLEIFELIENNHSQITQIDGVFIPPNLGIPEPDPSRVEGGLFIEKERFIRSLAQINPDYPESVPPVLTLPILEIKVNFRPRWSSGTLSQHVPPYYLREITDHIGKATTRGNLFLAPRVIIFARLRSLGPNFIYHFYPDSRFYAKWAQDILDRLEAINELPSSTKESFIQANNEYLDNLVNLFAALSSQEAYLAANEEAKRSGFLPLSPGLEAKQRKLRGLESKLTRPVKKTPEVKPLRKKPRKIKKVPQLTYLDNLK